MYTETNELEASQIPPDGGFFIQNEKGPELTDRQKLDLLLPPGDPGIQGVYGAAVHRFSLRNSPATPEERAWVIEVETLKERVNLAQDLGTIAGRDTLTLF